ncbi:MAG: hypothetical protein WDA18_07660 [Candidatus Ratteibacteria bacterium]|jgi:hypothetical protein
MEIKAILRTLIIALLFFRVSPACEVPVFQYAMEYWEQDRYDLYLFHRGALVQKEEKNIADALSNAAIADYKNPQANIEIHYVDISSRNLSPQEQSLWEEQKTSTIPWVALYYPFLHGKPQKVWAGPLKKSRPTLLLSSPKRNEIAQSLLEGDTAVWLFLKSGNNNADNTAIRLLKRELKRLEKTLRLPNPEQWGWEEPSDKNSFVQELDSTGKSKIRFSLMIVDRDDPFEEILLNILLKSEKDLLKLRKEPMVFPIYGRALILYSLVGKGINEWTINRTGEFITGPCSCEVKAGNPGTDLLMYVNWQNRIAFEGIQSTPPLTGISEFFARQEKEKEIAATLQKKGEIKNILGRETPSFEGRKEKATILSDNNSMVISKEEILGKDPSNPFMRLNHTAALFILTIISTFLVWEKKKRNKGRKK